MTHTGEMDRHVHAWMRADVAEGTEVALLIAPSDAPLGAESVTVSSRGQEHPVREIRDARGNRMHLISGLSEGPLEISYTAGGVTPAAIAPVDPVDHAVFLRPSRYCEVDEFANIAAEIVGEREGHERLAAVVDWVHDHLDYVPGASTVTDSARSTYLSREGVCRDYAHLTATLLRASGIPARCVAVYAPGLTPMDFHLVVEALLNDRWCVVDATHMAPRSSMVRIATGQDAADTAFMTTVTGNVTLTGISVGAVVDPALPVEGWGQLVDLR